MQELRPLRTLTRDRVRNLSRDAIKSGSSQARAAAGGLGAVAYSIMDLASAIRELREPDAHVSRTLRAADELAEAVLDDEGGDPVHAARWYQTERAKIDQPPGQVDQRAGEIG